MRARHRHFRHRSAGAVLAYDARYLTESEGTTLQTWVDRVGAYDATESDSTKRPTVRTGANGINGQTALDFDGSNDDLQAASVPLNTYITVIVCAALTLEKPMLIEHGANAGTQTGFYFYGSSGHTWTFFRQAVHFGGNVSNWMGASAAIASLRYDGATVYRVNGGAALSNTGGGSARTNSSTTANLNILSRNRSTLFSDGLLGTLAIYDGAASDSMAKRLEHHVAYSFKIACN